jgi:hypothetical protein
LHSAARRKSEPSGGGILVDKQDSTAAVFAAGKLHSAARRKSQQPSSGGILFDDQDSAAATGACQSVTRHKS